MLEDYQIRQITLRYEEERRHLVEFLGRHHLSYETDIQCAFGIFTVEDRLVGCGCAARGLLKCFAIEPELRGQNALGLLVSTLTQECFSAGYYDLFVITRNQNEFLFSSCGLSPVVRTQDLIMLENRPNGPESFAAPFFRPGDEEKVIGAIVMNCSPFTLGHRGLVEYAAGQCDVLHLFVVEEDRSLFPTQVRFQMVQEGTVDLPNVRVHLSGHYIISAATFPTYFLKEDEDATELQCELDITLFATRIAPVLHITKRFAGQEPLDPTTARYNQTMEKILPTYGIQFHSIPRLAHQGHAISASWVRALLQEPGGYQQALLLVPESTRHYLKLTK